MAAEIPPLDTSPASPRFTRVSALLIVVCAALGIAGGALWGLHRQPSPEDLTGPTSGPPLTGRPGLAGIAFGVEGSREPAGDLLPAGCVAVSGSTELPGGEPGAPIAARWWWCGVEQDVPRVERRRARGGVRVETVLRLAGQDVPFGAGVGELEFYSSGERVARGSFVVAASALEILGQTDPSSQPTSVDAVKTCLVVGPDGAPQSPKTVFQPQERVFLSFRYRLAEPGTEFRVNWYAGGRQIEAAETRVAVESAAGWAHAWLGAGRGGLPEGSYQARVTYGSSSEPLGTASFRVVPGDSRSTGGAPKPATKGTPGGAGALPGPSS